MDISGDKNIQLLTTIDTTVDIDESNLTPIQEFYYNSTVFVTGCTGFLGQVLLEKLLRSCPVSKIYVLVRNKKGKDLETRLDDIFKDTLFQRIRNQFPETLEKVVPIEGDCTLPDLGLSDQDKVLLIDEVEIIFHVAATVRFDAKLKTAVFINIRAPRDLVRLAHRMPRLKSFMHISTAFCNCIHKVIEETIYAPAANYEGMIAMVEYADDNILDEVTPRIVGKYPNTYTYTKQIAEDVIRKEGQGLPIGIHRPAIVISTYKEPVRGWINNIYGATGHSAGVALGIIRACHITPNLNSNVVPVDMCVNSMITAAWDVSEAFKRKDDEFNHKIPVYNFESSNDKPITWMAMKDKFIESGLNYPSTRCVWYYSMWESSNYYSYCVIKFLVHTIPAIIVDAVLLCKGKPTMMVKAYTKIEKFTVVVSHFTTNEWRFKSENLQNVISKMTERDSKIFFCDLKKFDWDEFFKCYVIGARLYLVKESFDTLPEARMKYKRLYWYHRGVTTIVGVILIWTLWSLMSIVFNI